MIGFHDHATRSVTLLLGALALTACPSDDTPADTDGNATSSATSTGPSAATESEPGTTSEATSADESGTETSSELCGNGEVDPGEDCDDANGQDDDGCTSECRYQSCTLAWNWQQPIESGNPGASDVFVDADQNVYVTGDLEGGTDNDIWVAKWNPDGTQAWSNTYGGAGINIGFGIAVDEGGDVYIAARTAGDGDAMYFARLSGADGSEVWTQIIDSRFAGEDDLGIGVAINPDGDPVVTGRIRVGDGDDDVWVSRRSAADGSEIWATTWSGEGDGMFSTDRVGPMDIAPDGTIWVGAREHLAFDHQEGVLLQFDPDGNLVSEATPNADGKPHDQSAAFVAAYDGGVYFVVTQVNAAYRAWLYRFDNDGNEEWTMTQEDWIDKDDTAAFDYRLRAMDVDDQGRLVIGGNYEIEGGPGDHEWLEAWMAQVDADGNYVCRGSYQEDDGAPFAAVLSVFSGAAGPQGGLALSGRLAEGAGVDSWLWTGYFAP
ncbi:MAG: hypothetical protein AAF799_04095 [Myxococcota bacterium]